jgi:hypothetical protein
MAMIYKKSSQNGLPKAELLDDGDGSSPTKGETL